MKIVAQTATIAAPASATAGKLLAVTGAFTPPRPGRATSLQRHDGSAWITVKTGIQSTTGKTNFSAVLSTTGRHSLRVVTAAAGGAPGKASAPASVTVESAQEADTTPPPSPTGVQAAPGDTSATLSWQPVTAPDLAGYLVYSSASPSGPWVKLTDSPIQGTSKTLTGLSNGSAYTFALASVDATGNESSKVVSNSVTPRPSVEHSQHCGTLPGDETWGAGVHVLTCGVLVPNGVTLTLMPGAIVKAKLPTGGSFPYHTLAVEGALKAAGTAQSPIVFTSLLDDSVGGDSNGDGGSSTPSSRDWGGIWVRGTSWYQHPLPVIGSVTIDHARIRFNGGLQVDGANHASVTNSIIEKTVDSVEIYTGLRNRYDTGKSVVVKNNIVDSTEGGITVHVYDEVPDDVEGVPWTVPVVSGNVATNTGGRFAISVTGRHLHGELLRDNVGSASAPGAMHVSGRLVTDISVPLSGSDSLILTPSLEVASGATMSIAPGTTLAMGGRLTVRGSVVGDGTTEQPVTFTSYDDPALDRFFPGTSSPDGAINLWNGFWVQPGGNLALGNAEVNLAYTPFWLTGGNATFHGSVQNVGAVLADVDAGHLALRGTVGVEVDGDRAPGVTACNWGQDCSVDAAYVDWSGTSGPFRDGVPTFCGAVLVTPWVGWNSGQLSMYQSANCDGSPTPSESENVAKTQFDGRLAEYGIDCSAGMQEACDVIQRSQACLREITALAWSNVTVAGIEPIDGGTVADATGAWLSSSSDRDTANLGLVIQFASALHDVVELYQDLTHAAGQCTPPAPAR